MLIPNASTEASLFLPTNPFAAVCLSDALSFPEIHRPLPLHPHPASDVAEMITDNENLRPADTGEREHRGEAEEEPVRMHVIRRVI